PIYDLANAKLTRFVRDGKLLYWKSTYRYRKNDVRRGQGSRPVICRSVKPTRSGMDGELLQEKSSRARKPKMARGYENWALQRSRTESVAYNNPFSVLPFYHYDFRRYISDADPDGPFAKVVPPGGRPGETPGPYVGFKLYTAEGYRPLELAADSPYAGMSLSGLSTRDRNNIVRFQTGHTKLVELQRNFYQKCEDSGTPVLCHCSDGGVYTHDRELYVKLFADKQAYPRYRQRSKRWFNDHYVHPKAWRRVLTKYPKLKLCLAHWGGIDHWRRFSKDWRRWRTRTNNYSAKGKRSFSWIEECVRLIYAYDNFYVDLAYLPLFQLLDDETRDRRKLKRARAYEQRGIQWDYLSYLLDEDKGRGGKLRRRILWGTDWYMFGQDFESYGEYLSRNISALEKIQQRAGIAQNLFHQFAVVNNCRYLALPEIAEPLYQHFRAVGGNAKQRAKIAGNRWRIDAFKRLDAQKMQSQLDRNSQLTFEEL
ncbi:MAG: amidohydrolase family protein, partial [Deltaproteobacteria bacterium]|nr:amidohydrolase family protein [Deltaproteobacteria bacterium]